ncbi:MAG: hypothetical protein QF733_03220 [Phycisphaerales bacterium]|nr:hypothetical protein [Phycisphaerales bacterium]
MAARKAGQRMADFLVPRPVSRRRILFTCHAVACLLVLRAVVLSSGSIARLSPAVGEHMGWPLLMAATLSMCLSLWTLICLLTVT